ncbi:diaminopimelate decarboxylase [Desulfobulbus oligotrophicus]|uniref:Diaminopimelate decarboxylase n=1 Tax=Desulfobulbus oligotrophicus TaxID=1909699 RepID=A0A7T5VEV5_9BACT|nr:diaminopimelate decarboxylase [Desulfobulbus oligotrophicus]QQG66655.1 diaminopimelate decarboxylase [Desulfobulbus oligotrophicus]
MPMSQEFKKRLFPVLPAITAHFGTPFHIYDEIGIRKTGQQLQAAFADIPVFREYYAVKALPNPAILSIMQNMGFGFDCSSITELMLARSLGARGHEIMFTSNNTSADDFAAAAAADGGCILNLDDISLIDKVPQMPELICFRYNPGPRRIGNDIIGKPEEAKYGVSHEQIIEAYRRAQMKGAKRFGLHTMLASNELDYSYMVQTTAMLFELVESISQELDITFDFINIGGGLGIPYLPDTAPLDIKAMGKEIVSLFGGFADKHGYCPALFMESGRYMTGPHGVMVTTAINRKDIYRTYIGVDACMSALMRPALYGAYHHIDVLGKEGGATETVDVVGSLCENNDKFAIQRSLPEIVDGDILIIHDSGAHGHAMGFNYNGRLRPQELLLRQDGSVALIRRAERPEDYFATLQFENNVLQL